MSGVAARRAGIWGRVVAVGALALAASPAWVPGTRAEAQMIKTSHSPGDFMRVFGQATAPYGWGQFCRANPSQCRETRVTESRVPATRAMLAELDTVNRAINTAIQPATDLEVYGVTEYWTLPTTRGDCEDYALLKRKVLAERGWPTAALLMTVVRDETGDGHAVLTVRTTAGDYVLDNKVSDIKLWHETPYTYVMRQSYLNPHVWVSLDPGHGAGPAAIAGVRPNGR
ncbi:MAG: transglutaminase-like cysteine peptidase [Hyphomicrobiaceae bacterium]